MMALIVSVAKTWQTTPTPTATSRLLRPCAHAHLVKTSSSDDSAKRLRRRVLVPHRRSSAGRPLHARAQGHTFGRQHLARLGCSKSGTPWRRLFIAHRLRPDAGSARRSQAIYELTGRIFVVSPQTASSFTSHRPLAREPCQSSAPHSCPRSCCLPARRHGAVTRPS